MRAQSRLTLVGLCPWRTDSGGFTHCAASFVSTRLYDRCDGHGVQWRKGECTPATHTQWPCLISEAMKHLGLPSLQTCFQRIGNLTDSSVCDRRHVHLIDNKQKSTNSFSWAHLVGRKTVETCTYIVDQRVHRSKHPTGHGRNRKWKYRGEAYAPANWCSPYSACCWNGHWSTSGRYQMLGRVFDDPRSSRDDKPYVVSSNGQDEERRWSHVFHELAGEVEI